MELQPQLTKLSEDQQYTKSSNEELNGEIAELQSKIEAGNKSELDLQEKYKGLMQQYEEEKKKYENMLAEENAKWAQKIEAEKSKWEYELNQTKQAKDQLVIKITEEMVKMEELKAKQPEECEQKMENLLKEREATEKAVQDQMMEEKRESGGEVERDGDCSKREREAKAAELEKQQKEIGKDLTLTFNFNPYLDRKSLSLYAM